MRMVARILMVALISAACAHAADWYVASANDGGAENGLAWETAWGAWPDVSWGSVTSGDTIWIDAGTYTTEWAVVNESGVLFKIRPGASGQAHFSAGADWYNVDNCTWDGMDGGERKFLITGRADVGGPSHSCVIRLTTNAVFRGIEINRQAYDYASDASQVHCIQINGSQDFLTFDNLYLHHNSGDGINITHGALVDRNAYDSFVIQDCVIEFVGDDAIQNGTQMTIRRNVMRKTGQESLLGGHADGYQSPSGRYGPSHNYKVYANIIVDFDQSIFMEYTRSNVWVYNNVCIETRGASSGTARASSIAVWDLAPENSGTARGTWLYANNVAYGYQSYTASVGTMTNGVVDMVNENNVYVNCKYIRSSGTTNHLTESNIWWDEEGVQFYDTAGNPVSTPGERYAGGATYLDPGWNSTAEQTGFRPVVGSGLIDAGTDLSVYFDTDAAGHARPRGAGWDIGAHEFGALRTAPDDPPLRLWLGVPQ